MGNAPILCLVSADPWTPATSQTSILDMQNTTYRIAIHCNGKNLLNLQGILIFQVRGELLEVQGSDLKHTLPNQPAEKKNYDETVSISLMN